MNRLINILLTFILVLTVTITRSQDLPPAKTFPSSMSGTWKGILEWNKPGKPVARIPMEMRIYRTDTAGVYRWVTIYDNKDVRDYYLRALDSTLGKWTVDERNGIFLDGQWTGDRFINLFQVGKVHIVNSTYLLGEQMVVEFYSYPIDKPVVSGGKEAGSMEVASFPVGGYQRAVLSRQ